MNLFGPSLVAALPAWPPAADLQTWHLHPADLPEWMLVPPRPQKKEVVQFRPLDAVEWFELAARLGATFTPFAYEVVRAAAHRVLQEDALDTAIDETAEIEEVRDEFWSEEQQTWVHTTSMVDRLLAECQRWCRAEILAAAADRSGSDGSYVPMVNQYGRVYLCRGISWEESE